MDRQEDIFLQEEANHWFERNVSLLLEKKCTEDKIFLTIQKYFPNQLKNKKILELGCANGYRINWLKNKLNAEVTGVEPSSKAVHDGFERYGFTNDEITVNTSKKFFLENRAKFDCIVFGHSLYLVSPISYPDIVSGVMNSLEVGGYIIIYDFHSSPQMQSYHHRQGISSYKMEFDKLFTWHPQYKLLLQEVESHNSNVSIGNPKEDCALSVIKKININFAFPTLVGNIELEK